MIANNRDLKDLQDRSMIDLAPLTNPPMPASSTPPAFAAAAHHVAAATERHREALAALGAARSGGRAIQKRIATLTLERQQIIQRRAGGMQQADDGQRLALIDADREGLAPMAIEADEAVASAQQRADAEAGSLAAAQQQLAAVEAEEALARLVAHAGTLDTLLVTTVAQIGELATRFGRGGLPPFAPSLELVAAVRRAAAAHGRL